MKYLLGLMAALILMGIGGSLTLFLATRPVNRVVKSFTGPDGYTLAVVQADWDFRGFPFDKAPRYAVYVGRTPEPVYGHFLDYGFTGVSEDALWDVEKDIERCTIQWDQQGVALSSPSGHILFIPKKMYEGGR